MDSIWPKRFQNKDNFVITNSNHAQKAFQVLMQMRKSGLLCDVTVKVDGVKILAHRNVLAACSRYFNAMFTGDLAESKSDCIVLHGVDAKALSMLVDFMYTSEIQITEENVQTLLSASNILQITDVKDACCKFLLSQLHPSNCIGICEFADLHACPGLQADAVCYIEKHFNDLVRHDEFLCLGVDGIVKLVSNDRLSVMLEEQVFEAVMSWMNHDLQNRECHLERLLEHVRLPLMSQDFIIQRVEAEPLMKRNSRCKDFLIEAMKYHLLKMDQRMLYQSPRTLPRHPVDLPKMLLVFGGQAPKAIRGVDCFDFQENSWRHLTEMPSRKCRCGVVVLGGLVYVVGGFNGSMRVRSVDTYDPVAETWNSIPSMEARRSTLGVAVLNGLIFAVGGFDGSTGLDSVECFNPGAGGWKPISHMSVRRSSVGVGVVGGLMYVVGGYDGSSRQCLSSVECYNPQFDVWLNMADMSCRRSGSGVGVVNKLLYAVGGHDGPLVRKSVEVYNPETNSWSQTADMNVCRRNAGIVSANGYLYVIGGDDGLTNLGSVEVFDPKCSTWTMLDCHMMTKRSYPGVSVLEKPAM